MSGKVACLAAGSMSKRGQSWMPRRARLSTFGLTQSDIRVNRCMLRHTKTTLALAPALYFIASYAM